MTFYYKTSNLGRDGVMQLGANVHSDKWYTTVLAGNLTSTGQLCLLSEAVVGTRYAIKWTPCQVPRPLGYCE